MYWNILVWLRIEIPDGFLHQISENLKIDDLVTGGTINVQSTLMFDKVWNGEYNEYAVDSRIIGVETLYSIEYTCWKVLEEKALLSIVLSIPI